MGQVALGFRSLLIKLAIFFVMAVLLAWALGGTLWPRAEIVDLPSVRFADQEWFWRLTAGGSEPGHLHWTLMTHAGEAEPQPHDGRSWASVVAPFIHDGALYYGGCLTSASGERWRIERVGANGVAEVFVVPDRLEVERQLQRVTAGMAIQDEPTTRRLRPIILDPPRPAAARDSAAPPGRPDAPDPGSASARNP